MALHDPILVYGAYGFTGQLIVEQLLAMGYRPLLAGRNAGKVSQMAEYYGLDSRVFDLSDTKLLQATLAEVDVLLQCAGPFIHTVKQSLEACLATRTHYVDITGEVEVLEYLAAHAQQAYRLGIVLLPGAGFDVVPSDCLAAFVKQQLPGAVRLQLAFKGIGSPSRGTALSILEQLPKGGLVRRAAKLEAVPLAHRVQKIDLMGNGRVYDCACIPWGDLSTAWHSTGIQYIETYMALPPSLIRWLKILRYTHAVLRLPWIKEQLRRQAMRCSGPDAHTRQHAKSYLWAKAEDGHGRVFVARLITPEGYKLTAQTASAIATSLLDESKGLRGFLTPSQAFGHEFILRFEGVEGFLTEA